MSWALWISLSFRLRRLDVPECINAIEHIQHSKCCLFMFNLKRILDKNSSDVDGRMDNSEQKKHKQESNGYAQQCCMQYCIIGNDFCTHQYGNWDGKKGQSHFGKFLPWRWFCFIYWINLKHLLLSWYLKQHDMCRISELNSSIPKNYEYIFKTTTRDQ